MEDVDEFIDYYNNMNAINKELYNKTNELNDEVSYLFSMKIIKI